jgi:hypothetical protein
METWDYKQMGELGGFLQNSWNQTLVTKLNQMSSNIEKPVEVVVHQNLKPIIKSLMVTNGYKFRFSNDGKNRIRIGDSYLEVLNYE